MESLAEQLLAGEIVRDIEDAETLITLLGVRIDEENDRMHASVAVYPDEKREKVIASLNRRAGDLAYILLKKMKVKKVPFLVFE